MTSPDVAETSGGEGEVRAVRALGAALGVAIGPLAGWGQAWSGRGDGSWYIWVLGALVGALVGALALPLFFRDLEAARRDFGPVFGAAFLFSVGLVAGSLVAFPMGAVMASVCGVPAGALGVALWRFADRRASLKGWHRLAAVAAGATALGLLLALWWTA